MSTPGRLLLTVALLACATQRAHAADVKDGTVAGDLGRKLDEQALATKGFSGVVLAVRDREVLLAKGYGLADRTRKLPWTAETVFDIGSITKQFTAAAILKLETQGKLRVSDSITRYFTGVPDDKKGVTLHHLLTHTAGLSASLGKDYDRVPREEFVKLALASKLHTPPGKTFRYSNAGYSLLGAIIEQLSDQTYERYVNDNLFRPAAMTRTGYVIPKWGKDELARGYRGKEDWGTPRDHLWADDGPYWHLRANGGLLSTVGDLYRWHLALEGDKVLSKEARAKFVAPHAGEGLPSGCHYAYGWVVDKTPRGSTVVHHNGANGYFLAEFNRFTDERTVYIMATNDLRGVDRASHKRLARVLFSQGPTSAVEAMFETLEPPADRFRLLDVTMLPGQPKPVFKANVEFEYNDAQGQGKRARAKLYLPESALQPGAKLPLFFAAGYELDDGGASQYLRRGFAVVTPAAVNPNPLVRGPNPDVALLHSARALPFVDDARVVIGGGSAGGWMTLLLAAETFPLAGAAADVPPVNWGYNGAYFFKQKALAAKTPKVPVLSAVIPMLADSVKVYGDDYGDATWFAHSPVAHVPTITCPVLGFWSTADVLVPIDQIAAKYVRPFDGKAFPEGFTMDPEKLTATKQGRLRLLDVLPEKDREVFVLGEDAIKKLVSKPSELPFSRGKQWSVVILDEGKPEPQVGHLKHAVGWSRHDFLAHVTKGMIAPGQLTPAKLERLMDRYAGKEWLPTKLKHLDTAEDERADVVRGLRTYVAAGAEHAKRFADLYGKLPAEKQALEKKDVERIGAK